MAQDFIGSITLLAFNFPPRGYAFCNGQTLPIAQNIALFSLIGTTYGGNGQTTFALPDLRGRAATGFGQGPGLSDVQIGEKSGFESVALQSTQIPSHTHALNAQSGLGTTGAPGTGMALAQTVVDDGTPLRSYSSAAANTTLASTSIGSTGVGQALFIRNPYLGMNYCICTQGVFPSRN
jgi:microcystin-dependent protein